MSLQTRLEEEANEQEAGRAALRLTTFSQPGWGHEPDEHWGVHRKHMQGYC